MAQSVRSFVETLLSDRDKPVDFSDSEALFTSGLLDSMAATELMIFLESEHGFDLSNPDFDIARLDTINDLEALLKEAV